MKNGKDSYLFHGLFFIFFFSSSSLFHSCSGRDVVPITQCTGTSILNLTNSDVVFQNDIVATTLPCFIFENASELKIDGRGYQIIYNNTSIDPLWSFYGPSNDVTFSNLTIRTHGVGIEFTDTDDIITFDKVEIYTNSSQCLKFLIVSNLNIIDSYFRTTSISSSVIEFVYVTNLIFLRNTVIGKMGLFADIFQAVDISYNDFSFYEVPLLNTNDQVFGIRASGDFRGQVLISNNNMRFLPDPMMVGFDIKCRPNRSQNIILLNNYVYTTLEIWGNCTQYNYAYKIDSCRNTIMKNNTAILSVIETPNSCQFKPSVGGIHITSSIVNISDIRVEINGLTISPRPPAATTLGDIYPDANFGIYMHRTSAVVSNSTLTNIRGNSILSDNSIPSLQGYMAAGIIINNEINFNVVLRNILVDGIYGGNSVSISQPLLNDYDVKGGDVFAFIFEGGSITIDIPEVRNLVGGNGSYHQNITNLDQCRGGIVQIMSDTSINFDYPNSVFPVAVGFRNGTDCIGLQLTTTTTTTTTTTITTTTTTDGSTTTTTDGSITTSTSASTSTSTSASTSTSTSASTSTSTSTSGFGSTSTSDSTSTLTSSTSTSTTSTTSGTLTTSTTSTTSGGERDCNINNGGCDWRRECSATAGCGPCSPGYTLINDLCSPMCGNGVCDANIETCVTCPYDCPASECAVCGDLVCSSGEDCSSCIDDCGPCVPDNCDCSGHGTCYLGVCKCNDNWTGPDCQTKGGKPIVYNPDLTPDATLNPDGSVHSFFVSLKTITEMSENNTVVAKYEMPELSYMYTRSLNRSNIIHKYTSTCDNGAIILVTLYQFFEPRTTLSFANTSHTFISNTFKFNIKINNWPFRSSHNFLHLSFYHVYEGRERECIEVHSDEVNNVLWIGVIGDKVWLYGQFLDLAEIDGRVRKVRFKYENQFITAIVPHFWKEAELDPQYNLVSSSTKFSVKCETKELNIKRERIDLTEILTYVLASVGVVVAAVVGIILLKRKRERQKLRQKFFRSRSGDCED